MTELIAAQAFQVVTMFVCGMSIGMIFDVQKKLSRRVANYRRLNVFVYLVFWLVSSWLFSVFLYRCSHGTLSIHTITMTVCGYAFYMKSVRKFTNSG